VRTAPRQVWRTAAAVLAVLGSALALVGLLGPVPGQLHVVLLVVSLLPGAVLLGAWPAAQRSVGVALVLAGLAGLVAAGVLAGRSTALDPYLATMSLWSVLSVGSVLAAFPLAVAVLLAGAGLLSGRRGPIVGAAVLGALVAVWYLLVLVAPAIALVDDYGFSLQFVPLAPVGVLVAAAALLSGLAGSGTALRDLDRPAPLRPPRRRVVVVASVIVVVAAGAVGSWLLLGPRLVLADVFPDPALARCVAAELGEGETTAKVSRSDLGQVLSLTCNGDDGAAGLVPDAGGPEVLDAFRMQSLQGVELLENLASLDLRNNRISDLTPLTGLARLGQLTLTNNEVGDLAPLATLPVLGDLGLSGNRITDLGPLSGVSSLRLLGLADNRITDLGPLGSGYLSSLVELDVSRNQVADLSPLTFLGQLDRVQLADNRITDLAPLGTLTRITMLDVSGNQVADVSGLQGCQNLGELWLGRNPLGDIAPLVRLPALTGVDIEGLAPSTPGIEELRARGIYVGGLA
jgi:internalin A